MNEKEIVLYTSNPTLIPTHFMYLYKMYKIQLLKVFNETTFNLKGLIDVLTL
jgi:hypothetical protein